MTKNIQLSPPAAGGQSLLLLPRIHASVLLTRLQLQAFWACASEIFSTVKLLHLFPTFANMFSRVVQKKLFLKVYAANGFSRYTTLKNDIDKIFQEIFNF